MSVGIHGDEKSGIRVCQLHGCTYEKPYIEFKYNNNIIGFLIANVKASKENKHYLDSNLNDCFGKKLEEDNHELKIANQLIKDYGKKSGRFADIIIDMHSTEDNHDLLMFPSLNTKAILLKIAADLNIIPYYCSNDKGRKLL